MESSELKVPEVKYSLSHGFTEENWPQKYFCKFEVAYI